MVSRPQNSETLSKVKRQQEKMYVTHIACKGLTGLQDDLELSFGHVSLKMPVRLSSRERSLRSELTKEIHLNE